MKTIIIPAEQRKKTSFISNIFYDTLEIHDNKVVGYLNGNKNMTWYFKDYIGIDFVKANMSSQFAQVVFLTGKNSNNRAFGIDLKMNKKIMNDTNRILFCSGMYSFSQTNNYANSVAEEIKEAFENWNNNAGVEASASSAVSSADEIKKFKELLDMGIITQEEFDAKKKQLLGL